MAQQITDANFKELINGNKPLVVDFWAEWCSPCRAIGPIIEEFAQKYENQVVVGKVNVDENIELTDEFEIRSIPTILFFNKNGEVVDKHVGAAPKALLEEKLRNIL